MSSIVQHNMSAMNANRMLSITASKQQKSTEKLSSGYRINRAGDDAAGLAISEKMRGQIKGLTRASANSQDGISMIQTAEGALTETHSIIQRMRELAVQASNDTNTDDDRTQIQNEIDQLTQEVDRIANTTEFNTKKLLNGDRAGSLTEKAGKANVDSSFGNSMVSASVTTNGADKAAFTDVIRVEITKDFTDGQSTANKPKLSDDDIDRIYKLVSSSASVDLPKVLQVSTGISVSNADYSANQSTAENIAGALKNVRTTLQTEQGNAIKSQQAVDKNNDADIVNKYVDDLFKVAEKSKATDGSTFIKSGVTKDDLKQALNDYINAYITDGKLNATNTYNADGSADAISEAENKLASMFVASSNTTALGAQIAANSVKAEVYKASDPSSSTSITVSAAITASSGLGAAAAEFKSDIIDLAKAYAGTVINDNIADAKVEQLESYVDALSNTDLSTAAYEYKKAVDDLATATTNNASDDKKAELQAKIDETKAALDKLNVGESVMTVSDLFGSSDDINKFKIGSEVDDKGNLTINMKNKSGDDTIITIANANMLKAGDVITITSEAMVESKQAATGKEAFRLQVGANAGQEVSLGINSMKAKDLNIVQTKDGVEGKALDVTTQAGASMAINAYDLAIQKVSTERAKMGAMQNRLEHTIANLDSAAENTQNAESRIRDTDMASEMVEFSKNNILAQAGQSMLAQANQSNQGVLSLLG